MTKPMTISSSIATPAAARDAAYRAAIDAADAAYAAAKTK